jgi:hypothetical protein
MPDTRPRGCIQQQRCNQHHEEEDHMFVTEIVAAPASIEPCRLAAEEKGGRL